MSWTRELAACIIEHMFGKETAFRHYMCGGVIYEREWPYRIMFECDKCWEFAPDLLELIMETEESDLEIRYVMRGGVLKQTED